MAICCFGRSGGGYGVAAAGYGQEVDAMKKIKIQIPAYNFEFDVDDDTTLDDIVAKIVDGMPIPVGVLIIDGMKVRAMYRSINMDEK